MPVYSFECGQCGARFDKRLSVQEVNTAVRCPAGHDAVHRVFAVPTVIFKGSGFYSTDHRKGHNDHSAAG